jgi:CRISPR type I-E/ECOLI-associated protein CasA/Cse1
MSFDLLAQPWIPVSDRESGEVHEVGIREALVRAHEWGEVPCASPLVAVALVRLLLAVLHRACPPADFDAWAEMWEAKRFPEARIDAYLNAFRDRFDLFDEDRPFLQIGRMEMAQAGPLAQLATEVATGNNPTLFDHTRDDAPPAVSPAEAARRLVAAQAFALGFGKAAEARVNGTPWPRPYLADGICLRGVTMFLSGDSLFQTLMLNLVSGPVRQEDAPCWEADDPTALLDQVVNGERVSQPARGPVERYAWMSRMIRLLREPDGTVRRAYFTQGREADKSSGDFMKVFLQSKKEGRFALGLNADKAAWRDLHTFLGALGAQAEVAPVVRHAAELIDVGYLPAHTLYSLNVVGLATDPGKAGKFLLWRQDRMSIAAALLADKHRVEEVQTALEDATFVAEDLRRRIREVAGHFLPPEGNPDPKDVDNLVAALDPRRPYWARLEAHFAHFLLGLAADAPAERAAALKEWRRAVAAEAQRALRAACDQLGHSTRAIRATSRVMFEFNADKADVTRRIKAARQPNRRRRTNDRA